MARPRTLTQDDLGEIASYAATKGIGWLARRLGYHPSTIRYHMRQLNITDWRRCKPGEIKVAPKKRQADPQSTRP